MPGLPSLPTDNLYKFLALSGLFLIGLAFYLSVSGSNQRWERLSHLSEKIAQVEGETRSVATAELISAAKHKPTAAARIELARHVDSVEAQMASIRAERDMNRLLDDRDPGALYFAPLYNMGRLLTLLGFVGWLLLLQLPQDRLLRIELTAARARANGGTPQTNDEQSKTRIRG